MSERQACELAGVAVSSYRYRMRRLQSDEALKARLTVLAQQYPRFGSPRLCVLVRREQIHNHKRVERIYREAGLSLRRKKRKHLSRQRLPAMIVRAANEEWALDFVTDALASARTCGSSPWWMYSRANAWHSKPTRRWAACACFVCWIV